ncbi:MAG TPA: NAD-dependent epimerase/dehydratase family protein [Bradyrhizobium sp.]|jgi:dihydroflavonol-4-reductase|uniref:NAD-dependent epimerase/dehydratase family protein n=1 Tax=Bradyrhizobium sp. TaxID=376 RepID=UPI002C2521A6|nr:NAD-dependent epimerase/dehydratase family protein [Bradyrhizobium sp.]HXB78407.1 NAD-dependent epimerase/dehydratase family protein [Bradyrhizobium sp.]
MTRVLVTGGTGFIGQHLVSALATGGRQVRVLDLRAPICAAPEVEYVQGSVLDPGSVTEALADVGEVYHLAGLPGMWLPQKADFDAVNRHGTEVVIMAARKKGVSRFLHCSTESILFRPSPLRGGPGDHSLLPPEEMPGLYTRSKMLAERFATQAAASGFPLVIGTPTMPIGPHDHNLTPPTAMLQHFLHARLQLYLDFVVNLVDVRDVATGLILAMERGQIGQRYILGGESIPLKKILQLTAMISGRRSLSIAVPGRLAEISAKMLELISDHVTHRPPTGTAEGVRIAMRATDLSIDKARRELGYAPRPVEPTLRDTIAYLLGSREHHKPRS